jgi:hypothetical protein
MQAGLSGIMSEEFRAQIASRTHSALDMRARQGKATGGKCYGYSKAGEIIEAEAAIVREVFDRAARGETHKSIARGLNARGVAAPGASWKRKTRRSDGVWLVSAINSMLGNERYVGRVTWNRSIWRRDPDSGKRQRVERPESEWIETQGPAVVSRDIWDEVRARATPRKLHGGTRGGGPRYLLSGLLVCGICGSKLIAAGNKASHYYCSTHRHGGEEACSMSIGARRDLAEFGVLEPIRENLLCDQAVELAVEMIARWRSEERAEATRPAELEELDRRIARLDGQVAAGALDREDIAPSVAALLERRRSLLSSCWRQASGRSKVSGSEAAERYRSAAERLRATLEGPVADARVALHEITGDLICRPDGDELISGFTLNTAQLLKTAGIVQNGSGGALLHQSILYNRMTIGRRRA